MVRVIDVAKRNALQAQLLASVATTGPGEKLDEKLAALALNSKTGIDRTRELHGNAYGCTVAHMLLYCIEQLRLRLHQRSLTGIHDGIVLVLLTVVLSILRSLPLHLPNAIRILSTPIPMLLQVLLMKKYTGRSLFRLSSLRWSTILRFERGQ